MPHQIVLIGPPGAGKSTIAELLVQQMDLVIIATGQRLRAEIAAGSPIGREIGPLLERGHFAPDAMMDQLMRSWLAAIPPGHSFLLDGYPRSPRQAAALEGMLADLRRPLSAVVALELGEAEAVRRLSGRRICRGGSGPSFTLHLDDDAAIARCFASGGALEQRDDDQPDIIRERMRVYARETAPLLAFYADSGLLRRVDAAGDAAAVAGTLLAALAV